MNHHSRYRTLAAALALALLGSAAQAAPKAGKVDPLRLQYERERANCVTGQTRQPRDACLREASAAYAQARQGRLASPSEGPEQWLGNALKRCQAQPVQDRDLCERRVREGQVSGSVEGGGELKTLTVRSTDIPKSPGN